MEGYAFQSSEVIDNVINRERLPDEGTGEPTTPHGG
jgi:hypothetical protein